jgi:hypothetical protein
MTLGVTTAQRNQVPTRNAFEDRHLTRAVTGTFGVSPSLEVSRTIDPSDGANVSGGSSYVPGMPLLPSSSGLAGVLGASDEGIISKIRASDAYLARMAGKPWPSVATDPDFLRPTAYAQRSSINRGWNAAAQPGAAPGLAGCGCKTPPPAAGNGFREINVGPMSWEEALLYSPAPLTDNLGSLRSLDSIYAEADQARAGLGAVSTGEMLPLVAIGGLMWWLFSR